MYFEDEGADGAPVILHDGFADSVQDLREWALVDAIASEGFRVILADHRGHGRSDKPHDPAAYAMLLRVADAVAILDRLGIERAHFVGRSWGGRLCFGIGEYAPGRVRSLVIGGTQPYGWPESPISRTVGQALAAAREQVSSEPLVRAFEALWDIEFPARSGSACSTTTRLPSTPRGAQHRPRERSRPTSAGGRSMPDLHRRCRRGLPRGSAAGGRGDPRRGGCWCSRRQITTPPT